MSDDRELIRSRINLVELIGSQVRLQKRGKNWTGLCPFHEDKNPSFSVNESLGAYRCWSCGAKGDAFTWVMETQKVDFAEAMQILAATAGVTLSKRGTPEGPSKRGTYEGAMRAAQEFFVSQLSATAIQYCDARGLDEGIRAAFGLGFSPANDEALPTHLKRLGFALNDCQDIFLVEGDSQQGYRAKFRGRLMFPIRDERGAIVAFGGRLLGDGIPKYINSSDTPLYRKSRVLYAIDIAKDAISKANRAVLVEGYLDVIACHRAGVTEAVASLGTSLTEDHAKLLKRWCDRVTVLYDGDTAGRKAANRATEILAGAGIAVTVAMLPPGEDPDTLLRNAGSDAVVRAARSGLTPTEYKISLLKASRSFEEPEFWNEATELLTSASPLELERFLLDLAPKYPGIRDPLAAATALRKQVMVARRAKAAQSIGPTDRGQFRKRPRYAEMKMTGAESAILVAVASETVRPATWPAIIRPELFQTGVAFHMAKALRDAFPQSMPVGRVADWIDTVEPEDARQALVELWFQELPVESATYLTDAIAWLEKRLSRAAVRLSWQEAEPSDALLRDIQDKIKQQKT